MSDVAQPQRSASTSGACGLCSGRGGARRTLCTTGTRQVKQIACSVAAGVAGQKKICKNGTLKPLKRPSPRRPRLLLLALARRRRRRRLAPNHLPLAHQGGLGLPHLGHDEAYTDEDLVGKL